MTIRTKEEHTAAVARLEEMVAIGRTRSLTDDEQRDFDHLAGDCADYKTRTATGLTGPVMSVRQGKATMLAPLGQGPASPPVPPPPAATAIDPATSMRRTLAAHGMGPREPLCCTAR